MKKEHYECSYQVGYMCEFFEKSQWCDPINGEYYEENEFTATKTGTFL